jgi:hypothetical protein
MATLFEQIVSIIAKNDKQKFVHVKGTTGGLLNKLNEYLNCNAKKATVSVISLIGYHKPKTADELVALIKSHSAGHQHENCACGNKSQGTIETFAMNLYNKQLGVFKKLEAEEMAFDYECCLSFMYTLFVTYSMKGKYIEDKVVKELTKDIKKYDNFCKEFKAGKASEEKDFKYGVDVEILDKEGNIRVAIQVKPESYKNFQSNSPVVATNISKNNAYESKYKNKVFYLYYNVDETFSNYHILLNMLEDMDC